MFTTWLLTAGVLAIAAITLQSQGARETPPSAESTDRPWTGPYGGVPPWDLAKPELFPGRVRGGNRRTARRNRRDRGRPESRRSFDNTIAAMERSGQTLDRVEPAVRRDSPEHEHAGDSGARSRMAAEARGCRRCDRLQPRRCSSASRPSTSRCRRRTLTPEQKRLAERTYDAFVRRGARLNDAAKKRLSGINQELATLFSEFRAKVLADENTWTVLDREADLAGLPDFAGLRGEGRRRRAGAGWQVGDRQHAIQRRSVPDVLDPPRSAREGLEEVQEPRRQRRRERHQGDHRQHREAARRAREAARLSRATRTGGCPTRWRATRRRRRP